jgi:hypothetical protein
MHHKELIQRVERDTTNDDEAYEKAPLLFSTDKLAELVRRAEEAPSQRVSVPSDIMHKIFMVYLGLLEVYTEQTAAGTLINGERFLCSAGLSKAIAPIMDQHRRMQAEIDIDEAIAEMKSERVAKTCPTPIGNTH